MTFGAGGLFGALGAVLAGAQTLSFVPGDIPERTEIVVLNDATGEIATANAHRTGPAMSLAKLYLGYWVLAHGDPADKAAVTPMIQFSDDGIATRLDQRYPHAIGDIIAHYQLRESAPGATWGATRTSVEDVAHFLAAIRNDPIAAPLLAAMATAAPIAADGYHQDYGTAHLPGVIGTKFSWEDDHSVNGTASYGNGFIVVARTYGPAQQLSDDVATLRTTSHVRAFCVLDLEVPNALVPAVPQC